MASLPFIPYTIIHLALDNLPPLPIVYNKPVYLVFWFMDIPLGDIYAEGEEPKEFIDYRFIASAIKPAIQYYSTDYPEIDWENMLLKDQVGWVNFLEGLLKECSRKQSIAELPVSVIICTRNRPQSLLQTLQSFATLHHIPSEIIVVDNASDNDETEKTVQLFPGVKYVKEVRKGLDFARNAGVRNASSEIIAYVDDDVTIHPGWLGPLCQSFENPEIAAVTGLVIANKLDTEAQWIFEKFWSFNRGYADKIYDKAYFDAKLKAGPPVWEIGAGANMAFRKHVVEKLGFFDERLDAGAAGCNGDSEMWFRILKNGYSIHYNPRSVLFHDHRKEMKGLLQQIYMYMRGFTTACLIQHASTPKSGYKHHLIINLPRYYLQLLKNGFPRYHQNYKTLFAEIKGSAAGWFYYFRNRKKAAYHEHYGK